MKKFTQAFPNGARCSKRERECAMVKSVTLFKDREREREKEKRKASSCKGGEL